jgi:hypothetical protein
MQPLIAFDQQINTLIYIIGDGWGRADETFSARVYRCFLQDILSDKWYKTVDKLLWFDRNHCYESWRSEVERKQLPNFYKE